MGETLRFFLPKKKLELRISATEDLPKSRLLGAFSNKSPHNTLKCITSMKVSVLATGAAGDIGVFLLTTAVLEIVRRFSSAKCPFIWRGLQALQVLCCPPFNWMQRWIPFTGLVKRMKTLSKPLMFISLATGFFDQLESSEGMFSSSNAAQASPSLSRDSSLQLSTQDTRPVNPVPKIVIDEKWLVDLYEELNKQGINIPERLDKDELRRFYAVSDGDFARFLSSVKKTIRWRQRYTLLSPQELEAWGNLVFWHGFDMMQRPCLIVRIGIACSNLASDGRSQFVRAVVSQVEYGAINLIDTEHPQLTVLMDCEGLSPFGFPVQTFRSCAVLLQDHYPNRLGCLLVVRLPSVARVITQTVFQVLKPMTQQKLMIVGDNYQEVLSKYIKELPCFLGGKCPCSKCANEVDLQENEYKKMNVELTKNHMTGTSSDSDLYADTSFDINWEKLKVGVMGALVLWICVVLILGMYYRQRIGEMVLEIV